MYRPTAFVDYQWEMMDLQQHVIATNAFAKKHHHPHHYAILPNANTRDKRKAMHPAYF